MKKEWTQIAIRCLAFLLAVTMAVPPVYVSAEETEPVVISTEPATQPAPVEPDPTELPAAEPTAEPTEAPTEAPIAALAEETPEPLADNVKEYIAGGVLCTLTEDGVFTISKIDNPESGTAGVMCDYAANDDMPWYAEAIRQSITKLVVEEGVTVLGERIFNNATNLASVSLPSTLEVIGPRCFSNCGKLTEIELPDGLKTIGDTAFNGTGLKEVDLSNTQITKLGAKIFSACADLTTITLPAITDIGSSCFGSSSGVKSNKLTRINYHGSASSWSNINVDTSGTGSGQTYNKQLLKCTVFCTDGVYSVNSSYDTTAYTGTHTPVPGAPLAWTVNGTTLELVGWGVTPDFEAGKAPWADSAASLTSVTIDKYITGIGANAFSGCPTLSCSYSGGFDKLKANSDTEGNTSVRRRTRGA